MVNLTQDETLTISSASALNCLSSEDKLRILESLASIPMSVRQLTSELNKRYSKEFNPGTVSRHLAELEYAQLVKSSTEKNDEGITVKYYLLAAKQITFNCSIPTDIPRLISEFQNPKEDGKKKGIK